MHALLLCKQNLCTLLEFGITLITSQHLQDGWKLAVFLFFVFMDLGDC